MKFEVSSLNYYTKSLLQTAMLYAIWRNLAKDGPDDCTGLYDLTCFDLFSVPLDPKLFHSVLYFFKIHCNIGFCILF